jgi:hypothetical protein
MRAGALAATAALAFAAGMAVTLIAGGGASPHTGAPRAGSARSPADTPAAERIAELNERLKASEEQKAGLRERIDFLTRELDARQAGERKTARKGAGKTKGPGFVYAKSETALRNADWEATGEALALMMPLLSEFADVLHEKKELRPELWGDIMRWMGPIITEAIKLEQGGVPWSHPSVLVNLIHATLRKAGHPLTVEQEEEIYRIGLRFVEEDDRRRAAYGAGAPRLRQMIEEVHLQDRLYSAIGPLLNPEQMAVLYPPGVRGIVGLDVFAGSVVLDEKLQRIEHSDRTELRQRMGETLLADLALRPELRPALDSLVRQWEEALPEEYVFLEPDLMRVSDPKMEPAERVLFAASRQLQLYESILARMPLRDSERSEVLKHERIFVPFLRR